MSYGKKTQMKDGHIQTNETKDKADGNRVTGTFRPAVVRQMPGKIIDWKIQTTQMDRSSEGKSSTLQQCHKLLFQKYEKFKLANTI